MKQYFLYTALIISVLLACSKKDDERIFNESPDERLNAVLKSYQDQLAGAENGWKALVKPAGGGIYSFYFKFNNANRVTMYADIDSATAVAGKESSYRLKAVQQPSLLFDTYSYLHLLSDPVPAVGGAALGQGLLSDFEFYFDSVTADTVQLVGRVNSSKVTLVRATKQEADAYSSQQLLSSILQLKNLNKILYYFKRLTVGGKMYDVSINENNKTVTFTWVDGSGAVRTFNTTYYYTVNGIVFSTPFNDGSQTITGFSNITWNAAANSLTVTVNNNTGTITGVNSPIAIDKEAPGRWYNAPISTGSYWISVNGFHVNGVDDAFGVQTLSSNGWTYYHLTYFPAFGSGYDFFGPFFLNPAGDAVDFFYGSAPQTPTIRTDGRMIFRELGTFGAHPGTGPAALSRVQLYNAGGYYFVQTSPTSYDMVSATDARIWVSWDLL
jgi:hypothetical protein